ncbi:MAG: PAS domain-containing sensor histidine kinase [Longimicrobiales bacterium]
MALSRSASWIASKLHVTAVTLGVIVTVEVLLAGRLGVVPLTAILLLTVAWAAYRSGTAGGLVAAALTALYAWHVIAAGEVAMLRTPGLRVAAFALALGLMAVLVGRLHRKVEVVVRDELNRGADARVAGLMARAQGEIRFQAGLLDAVAQGVVATDLDGRIVYCNQAAAGLFDCDVAVVHGRTFEEIVPDASSVAAWHAEPRQPEQRTSELDVRRQDGSTVPLLITESPIAGDDGNRIGTVRVATDLSFRKQAEQARKVLADAGAVLASSLDYESTIRTLVHVAVPSLADCCLVDVVEEDGSMRRIEAAHVVPDKEHIVREIRRRHPINRDSPHPISDVIRTGGSRLLDEVPDALLRDIARDEQHLEVLRQLGYRSGMIVPLLAGGRTLGALSFFSAESGRRYDAADVALAEEVARRAATAIEHARLYETVLIASQAKSDFLAVVSHELRTPLTTVMGYADLLLSGLAEPLSERAELYVTRVRAAAWHLLGLIEQILIYARLEVGREKVHIERLWLADVLRDAAALIEPVAAERGIGFRIEMPDPAPSIETDMSKVRQILLNLLANAVKFTDDGEVILSAMSRPDGVVLLVRDTGIGIETDYLDKVFDPFWQVDQSATRTIGGAGLGLSVSRRLARLLGGDVTVDSRPGEGTTFSVFLPARFIPAAEADTPAARIFRKVPRS